jgi:hypothetical protein
MKPHRLRAPAADGALLAEPALGEAAALLQSNRSRLENWEHDFQGRRANRLRAMARQQVFDRARIYLSRYGLDVPPTPRADAPLIVAGHQPALFHAGVWVKNFAVSQLALVNEAAALNLVVDNDIPKGSSIRVPVRLARGVRAQAIEFDEGAGVLPYEDLKVGDEARFATFADRVREALGSQVPDPVIDDYWPRVLRFGEQTDRTALRFALARRELEATWGARNWEVPLSDVCETEAFLWFASHLLVHLPRFQEVHNAALTRYRQLHGIRSTHHPVPALASEGEWREAPFWAWRHDQPRRRPLFVRQLSRTMELRMFGETEPFLEIPLAPDREACCAVEELQTLPERKIRLRTRALTTTLFTRLLLGDLFVHGIGGAKYDVLGDEIVRGFYAIEPPSFLTLSMTLWLGLKVDPASPEQLGEIERELRDLRFNPDRHLGAPIAAEVEAWVEAKRRAIALPVDTSQQRRARFAEIRRCNEAMQAAVEPRRAELLEERAKLQEGLRHNAVVCSREFAFVLHSRKRLREAYAKVAPAVIGS